MPLRTMPRLGRGERGPVLTLGRRMTHESNSCSRRQAGRKSRHGRRPVALGSDAILFSRWKDEVVWTGAIFPVSIAAARRWVVMKSVLDPNDGALRTGAMGFLAGATSVLWGGGRILRDPQLRSLARYPVILTLVAYGLSVFAAVFWGRELLGLVLPEMPDVLWQVIVWYIAAVFLGFAFAGIGILGFSFVVEFIGGPFYDRMAARVLRAHGLTTKEPGFWDGTILDLLRPLLFLVPALGFGALSLTGLGALFGILAGLAGCLGLGSQSVNSALAVTGFSFSGRVRFVFQHVPMMLGVGGVLMLALTIPLLGLLAVPAAVVGASELYARAGKAAAAQAAPSVSMAQEGS